MGFHKSLFLLAFLLSQNLLLLPLTSASNCGVAKNLGGPKGLSSSLCHHHSQHGKSPPSHGGGGCGCSPTPSHGGGSHHHDPSSPTPYTPTPSSPTPYTPTPSSPTPYTPSPIVPSPPFAPYTPTPSTPGCTTPTTDPSSPPTPTGGYYGSPPPILDIPPPTPTITPILPSPPVPIDPGSGTAPFPCSFWGSHPGMIYGVLGWFGTVGGIFGMPSLPGFGTMDPSSMSLQKILSTPTPSSSSSSSSGYGSLYREASASFLNSLAAPTKFPYTTSDVRQAFASALVSDKAAADQARLFRLANEGHLKLV